jgi:hypothetical protein
MAVPGTEDSQYMLAEHRRIRLQGVYVDHLRAL